jgi:hypothetical protein
MTSTRDITSCSPAMIGVGGPAVGAAAVPATSLENKGSGGDGGNLLIGSILIDFTPITFSPKADAAISALLFAFATACFKRSFLICSDFSSDRLKETLLTSLTPACTAVSIHCDTLRRL